jgi:hypothetical protein
MRHGDQKEFKSRKSEFNLLLDIKYIKPENKKQVLIGMKRKHGTKKSYDGFMEVVAVVYRGLSYCIHIYSSFHVYPNPNLRNQCPPDRESLKHFDVRSLRSQ